VVKGTGDYAGHVVPTGDAPQTLSETEQRARIQQFITPRASGKLHKALLKKKIDVEAGSAFTRGGFRRPLRFAGTVHVSDFINVFGDRRRILFITSKLAFPLLGCLLGLFAFALPLFHLPFPLLYGRSVFFGHQDPSLRWFCVGSQSCRDSVRIAEGYLVIIAQAASRSLLYTKW
jgi:hypothetical protein